MIYKATLKKPWRSHRGKLYPSGSTFKLDKRLEEVDSAIYNFNAPGVGYGIVVLPNDIFKILTEEEENIRKLRKKMIDEHIKKTSDLFIYKVI